jgi:hypothetical protein
MMTSSMRFRALALALMLAINAGAAQAKVFPSPDAAFDALVGAARSDDPKSIEAVLGQDSGDLVRSGDPVADKNDRTAFVKLYDTKHRIVQNDGAASLVLGDDERPFPIAVRQIEGRWAFDLRTARQQILDRRIGRNELNAIEVCRAIVEAERDYASADRTGDGFKEYASKFMSDPGKKNGLYWEGGPGEPQSPLGPLVATARAQGYHGRHTPYHGYFYKILLRQGPHGPGGARDYLVRGHMIGGFAVVAWPAKWGDSGVMTFTADESGTVLQRNLGRDTARLAAAMTRFDPDAGWNPAETASAK